MRAVAVIGRLRAAAAAASRRLFRSAIFFFRDWILSSFCGEKKNFSLLSVVKKVIRFCLLSAMKIRILPSFCHEKKDFVFFLQQKRLLHWILSFSAVKKLIVVDLGGWNFALFSVGARRLKQRTTRGNIWRSESIFKNLQLRNHTDINSNHDINWMIYTPYFIPSGYIYSLSRFQQRDNK